ncbi:hypothetical protein [Rhodanobacter sp. DHG33]|uniref:hypothetical protein n=1 Tax=Rhodanobacter sp. DHG33 TaxID=2775921 RepID=UPI00177FA0BE|nr:hypothetical protein [Rhodanobacter sp. DHG33]MBD8899439.1 hypothetical protein [Rhodanobacter sp. DHG33]
MSARLALIACALCVLQPAIAAESMPANGNTNICRQALPTIRSMWLQDVYDAPPAVAAVMVDAIDGKLPQVRRGLAALPASEQARWRQIAMLTASSAYQPAVADGLLDDGAAVDAPALLPPLKQAFYRQTLDAVGRDPRFGGPATVKTLQAQGLTDNSANLFGPALIVASNCDDTATLDVLLRHHADVMVRAAASPKPDASRGPYALTIAVIQGYADVTQRLLDHGADACASDRLIRKPGVTLASIGKRSHLPDTLIRRLACPATGAH